MHGAREVLEASAAHIEQQILAIEDAVTTNPGLAFDFAKTLVESACKTVLSERGCVRDDGWDLPRLFKETLGQLRLVPDGVGGEQDVSDSLRKTVGGLQTAIQGICELRNTHGFASHGKDATFQQLERVQAVLVARAADTVVNFLFHVHRSYVAGVPGDRFDYADHPTFNDFVDETHELVRIFNLEYRPSEILFQVDPQAYRDHLTEYKAEPGTSGAAEVAG